MARYYGLNNFMKTYVAPTGYAKLPETDTTGFRGA